MKNNRYFQIEKTGYNYRTRKCRDILAVVLDANNKVIDAIAHGTGNHRETLDWAEWRAYAIRNDYPAAIRMEVYCGDEEIAVISFLKTNTTTTPRKKSINGIIDQATRLMSVCNEARNFKRADVIRAIAFRYYDNIRACVGQFNYDDNSEYDKEYSRAQYTNEDEGATRKKSINGIMDQSDRLMSVCDGARNFERAHAIRKIALRYYANIRAYVGRLPYYYDDIEYNEKYSRAIYMNANEGAPRKKSFNDIMNQANRLMDVCNETRNFKRIDVIYEIASRYDANIRACVVRFNYDDDNEYEKRYSRAQYMNAHEGAPRKKSINGIIDQATRLMSVCNEARNFKRADVIRAIAFRYYDTIRAYVARFHYDDDSEYNEEYSRALYMNA